MIDPTNSGKFAALAWLASGGFGCGPERCAAVHSAEQWLKNAADWVHCGGADLAQRFLC